MLSSTKLTDSDNLDIMYEEHAQLQTLFRISLIACQRLSIVAALHMREWREKYPDAGNASGMHVCKALNNTSLQLACYLQAILFLLVL